MVQQNYVGKRRTAVRAAWPLRLLLQSRSQRNVAGKLSRLGFPHHYRPAVLTVPLKWSSSAIWPIAFPAPIINRISNSLGDNAWWSSMSALPCNSRFWKHAQDQYREFGSQQLEVSENIKTATPRHGNIQKQQVPECSRTWARTCCAFWASPHSTLSRRAVYFGEADGTRTRRATLDSVSYEKHEQAEPIKPITRAKAAT